MIQFITLLKILVGVFIGVFGAIGAYHFFNWGQAITQGMQAMAPLIGMMLMVMMIIPMMSMMSTMMGSLSSVFRGFAEGWGEEE
jgi:uncharacterized membrane protein